MLFGTDYAEKQERDTFYAALFGAWDGEDQTDRDAIVKMMNRAYKPFHDWFLTYRIGHIKGGACCEVDLQDRVEWIARYAYRIDLRDFERITAVLIQIIRGERVVSHDFRRALCESVAILAGHEARFTIRTTDHIDSFADKIVHFALRDLKPEIWKALTWKIPYLAEASPEVFLSIIETNKENLAAFSKELDSGEHPLKLLSLLTSIFSALFWYDEHAKRAVRGFAYLSRLNDPYHVDLSVVRALVSIISPRQPLTHAEFVTQFEAMQAALATDHAFGWDVLLELLIERNDVIFSVASPKFDPKHTFHAKAVDEIQFRERIHMYVLLALKECQKDGRLFADIARILDLVRPRVFEILFDVFTPDRIEALNDEERYLLWDRLSDFSERNHMLQHQTEHLTHHQLRTIDRIIKHIRPQDPVMQAKRLFKYDQEFLIFRYLEEYTIETALFESRRDAVKEVYKHAGVDGVLELARIVDQPHLVGNIVASLEHIDAGSLHLQNLLDSLEQSESAFAEGYYEVKAR